VLPRAKVGEFAATSSYCTVIAAAETVTGTAIEAPPPPVTVIEHVPAASGFTLYVALLVVLVAVTLAMAPVNGEQVSLSVKIPA